MAALEVPSQVTNKKFLCVPQGHVEESDEEWKWYGKWTMTIEEADLDFVDRAWLALQPLVRDGTLVMLKASTPLMREEGSCVLCFTRPGKGEASRSAGAIRGAIDFRGLMRYKLNGHTDAGVARRYGHRKFTIYTHSYLGRFYQRDSDGGWTLDCEDVQDNLPAASPSCCQLRQDVVDVPSKSNLDYCSIGSEEGSNWYLQCSLRPEAGHRQPEADRVWIVARQLQGEGLVESISWRKRPETSEIRLYVAKEAGCVCNWLEHCDRICAEASTRRFMYFRSSTERSTTHVYTPEGELYERDMFVTERRRTPGCRQCRSH